MKITAREQDDIINRTAVLQAISSNKKAYIVNNTHDAEWFSPEFIIEGARNVMGTIDLDPCSCAAANERVKATEYYCKENDALDHEWFGTVFLNPPYTGVGKFINKLLESNIDQAVILVNNATETQWFKKLMEKASAIVFLTGRLHFIRSDDHTAGAPMQGQAVIYIGENYDVFYTEFVKYGWGALLNNTEHKRYDMFPSKEEDIYD